MDALYHAGHPCATVSWLLSCPSPTGHEVWKPANTTAKQQTHHNTVGSKATHWRHPHARALLTQRRRVCLATNTLPGSRHMSVEQQQLWCDTSSRFNRNRRKKKKGGRLLTARTARTNTHTHTLTHVTRTHAHARTYNTIQHTAQHTAESRYGCLSLSTCRVKTSSTHTATIKSERSNERRAQAQQRQPLKRDKERACTAQSTGTHHTNRSCRAAPEHPTTPLPL